MGEGPGNEFNPALRTYSGQDDNPNIALTRPHTVCPLTLVGRRWVVYL